MTSQSGKAFLPLTLLVSLFVISLSADEFAKICKICVCKDTSPYLVNCTDNSLQAIMPADEWPTDKDIEAITAIFDFNRISTLYQLPPLNICNLSLRKNDISEISDMAFGQLDQLHELDLSFNQLNTASLNSKIFQGLKTENGNKLPLITLRLSENDIHSLNADLFEFIPNLETLDLSGNPLMMLDLSTTLAISQLRMLKELNLADAQLRTLPDGMMHSLKSVRRLIIPGNLFDAIPKELQNANNLEVLNLNNNPIAKFNAADFSGLVDLTELDLCSLPKLEVIGKKAFSGLTNLKTLNLAYNSKLKWIDEGAFEGIDRTEFQLETFNIRDCALTYLPPPLLPWETLTNVDIQGNPWNCNCHLRWMAELLIKKMSDRDPSSSLNVLCAEPEKNKARSMLILSQDAESAFTCDNSAEEEDSRGRSLAATAGIILMLGIVLAVMGASSMTLFYIKRNRLRVIYHGNAGIKYERADSEDTTSTKEFAASINRVA